MPHFFPISESDRKNGAKNKHVINFKTQKEPKMKFFDFGASQEISKMLSHDKSSFTCFSGHFIVPPVLFYASYMYSVTMKIKQGLVLM